MTEPKSDQTQQPYVRPRRRAQLIEIALMGSTEFETILQAIGSMNRIQLLRLKCRVETQLAVEMVEVVDDEPTDNDPQRDTVPPPSLIPIEPEP